MAKMTLFAIMLATVLLQGCSDQNRAAEQAATPGDQYLLSSAELASLQNQADKGDLQAVKKLIQHYELAAPDLEKAMYWQRAAVNLGDLGAMLNLSTYLGMQGQEGPCREAVALIERAKESTTDSKFIDRANRKLLLLRSGVKGDGPCVEWLGKPNTL